MKSDSFRMPFPTALVRQVPRHHFGHARKNLVSLPLKKLKWQLPVRNFQNSSWRSHPPSPGSAKRAEEASTSATKTVPGPAYFWLDSLSAPLRFYTKAHNARPYLVQLISTLVIYLLGDLCAQRMTSSPDEPYQPARTVRALIIGGVAAVPGYKWFLWLGRSFNYSSRWGSIAVKVFVNQIVFTPVFNTYFFGMQSALAGASAQDVVQRIQNTVPRSWVNSLKLWPAVIAFNFAFVPLHFRSIFAGVIAIGWQTYLSFLNQRAAQMEREARQNAIPSQ